MRINGIDISDLDKKVILEYPVFTRDALTSEQVKTWATLTSVWGKLDDATNEKFEADQAVALSDGMWITRYVSGVNETMRINDGGVYHYIKGIKTTNRNITLILRTEKRDNI